MIYTFKITIFKQNSKTHDFHSIEKMTKDHSNFNEIDAALFISKQYKYLRTSSTYILLVESKRGFYMFHRMAARYYNKNLLKGKFPTLKFSEITDITLDTIKQLHTEGSQVHVLKQAIELKSI